jgi:hypothetical protein
MSATSFHGFRQGHCKIQPDGRHGSYPYSDHVPGSVSFPCGPIARAAMTAATVPLGTAARPATAKGREEQLDPSANPAGPVEAAGTSPHAPGQERHEDEAEKQDGGDRAGRVSEMASYYSRWSPSSQSPRHGLSNRRPGRRPSSLRSRPTSTLCVLECREDCVDVVRHLDRIVAGRGTRYLERHP